MKMKIQRLALPAILCLTALNAHADISINERVQFFEFVNPGGSPSFNIEIFGPFTTADDYSMPPEGFVRLLQNSSPSPVNPVLTVNAGSTLYSALGIYTTDFTAGAVRSEIYVDGSGSRIEIGSGSAATGNIRLNGKGDFDITNGAIVNWTELNNCSGAFFECDILIGATPASNTGIRVIGTGSLLDASNTNGRLFVGYVPSPTPYSPDENVIADSEDFLVIQDGGVLRSNGASVGKGFEGSGSWDSGIGYVQGTAFVTNGTWLSQSLNIGEGDGGSGNVFIVNGGIIDITTDQVDAGGFYLGQTGDGVPTKGGSNLLVVDGPGSTLNVDNNSLAVGASRIANGFVTVQNDGAIQLDSSFLLVSGKSGESLSVFNTTLADNVGIATGLSDINLDVLSEGSIIITDADSIGISALIIGQTPDSGPTQSAAVRVSGSGSNITVMNDPGLPKIALSATQFGIPTVSNIGTGSLTVEAGGSVTFDNGDFVIAARAGDEATVTVTGATLTADRVVVGWADFEAGVVSVDASSGTLALAGDGVIEGDVIVDDNGTLTGIGTINGTLFGEGGLIIPGESPGTITVESLELGEGTQLIMEVGLNTDGSINAAASDSIVATSGDLDLSAGEVTFELSSAVDGVTLEEILDKDEPLTVGDLFDSTGGEVSLTSFSVENSSGIEIPSVPISSAGLQLGKDACKNDGWESLFRSDESGSEFDNQGDCIQYVNTDK